MVPALLKGSPSGESARRTGAASGLQVMFLITHSFSDKRDQYLVYKSKWEIAEIWRKFLMKMMLTSLNFNLKSDFTL